MEPLALLVPFRQRQAFLAPQIKQQNDEELRFALIRLAKPYGRYEYRKIGELLRIEGWRANHKRVERLWREEKMLTVLDEYTREALSVTVGTKIGATEVLEALCPLLLQRGQTGSSPL